MSIEIIAWMFVGVYVALAMAFIVWMRQDLKRYMRMCERLMDSMDDTIEEIHATAQFVQEQTFKCKL
jgi:hypothetical protein